MKELAVIGTVLTLFVAGVVLWSSSVGEGANNYAELPSVCETVLKLDYPEYKDWEVEPYIGTGQCNFFLTKYKTPTERIHSRSPRAVEEQKLISFDLK